MTIARGIVAFATKFFDAVVPDSLRGRWSFAAPSPVPPISTGDARAESPQATHARKR